MNSLWKQNQVNFQVYFCNIFNVNSVYITLCSLMEHLSKFVCRFRISDFKFFVWQKLKCNFLLFMFIFMRWRWRPWDEKVVCVLFALFFWFRLFFFPWKNSHKKSISIKNKCVYIHISFIHINNKSVLCLTDLFHIHVCHADRNTPTGPE